MCTSKCIWIILVVVLCAGCEFDLELAREELAAGLLNLADERNAEALLAHEWRSTDDHTLHLPLRIQSSPQ